MFAVNRLGLSNPIIRNGSRNRIIPFLLAESDISRVLTLYAYMRNTTSPAKAHSRSNRVSSKHGAITISASLLVPRARARRKRIARARQRCLAAFRDSSKASA